MELDRRDIRSRRKELPDMSFQDEIICAELINFITEKTTGVLGYKNICGEPNLQKMYSHCDKEKIYVAYPICCDNNSLIFRKAKKETDFTIGKYGIYSPKNSCEIANADENTICVIPGLCFDMNGNRVGNGMGYYDRFLSEFPGIKIGVCYSEFIEKKIAANTYDIPMDYVVCESGIVYDRKGR